MLYLCYSSQGVHYPGSNSETEYVVHSPFIISDQTTKEPEEPGDYMVMFTSRRPSQQLLLRRHADTEEEEIFHLEQMNLSVSSEDPEGGLGPGLARDGLTGLTGLERRRYKKGNKHRGDYCLLDLGARHRRSSSFSSGLGAGQSRVRQWKTITYNKK